MNKDKIKEALSLVGNQHKYQKILIILISFSWIVLNFMLLGSTLLFMNPVFYCDGNFLKKVFEKQACLQINRCELVEKFTLTSSMGLYCQNQWARDLIQSIFSFGSIFGLLVINLISDTKSRKLALQTCLLIVSVGLIITAIGGWHKSIPTVIVAQFIQGFGISSIVTLSYAFLTDFLSDKLKPRAVIIVNTAWSFSTFLLGVFYLIELQWYFFILFIMLIPLMAIGVLFYFFLLESPYILMLRNKKSQAVKVLEKVSMINKRSQNFQRIKEIVMSQQIKNQDNKATIQNFFKILKKWNFLKPLIIISVIRMIGSLNFYGTSYAFNVEGLGLGYNSMIAGMLQIVSFSSLTLFIHRIPRKKGIAGFYFLVVLMGIPFLFPEMKQNFILGTTLMGISRIFSTIAYTLIASVQTQAFSVEIQSTAVGITEIFGLFGAMFGPLIVDLGDKIGVDPVLLITILVNFAIWPTYFLKQTLKTSKTSEKVYRPSKQQQIQKDENHNQKTNQQQQTVVGIIQLSKQSQKTHLHVTEIKKSSQNNILNSILSFIFSNYEVKF